MNIYHGSFCTDTRKHLASSWNCRRPSETPSDIWDLHMLSQFNTSQSTLVTLSFPLLSPKENHKHVQEQQEEFQNHNGFSWSTSNPSTLHLSLLLFEQLPFTTILPKSGGSQLCLHFALLSSTVCILKNSMQEYGPFIYSMAPSHRHQTIANYHTTT